jgi:hypothetical protein
MFDCNPWISGLFLVRSQHDAPLSAQNEWSAHKTEIILRCGSIMSSGEKGKHQLLQSILEVYFTDCAQVSPQPA